MKRPRAIIADDEEPLRTHLRRRLNRLWPDLEIAGEAADGDEAARLIEAVRPDIAFLDIRMPGISGLEAARRSAGKGLFVFVTAFDKYAIEAFEHGAIDYLLKPVTDDRLEKTVLRLRERLAGGAQPPDITAVLDRVTRVMRQAPSHLQWIKAQHRDGVRMIAAQDVYYFRAGDKYTTLRTKEGEFLIRKSIKELENELDPEVFWRVHRGAIVNVKTIRTVNRSLAGTGVVRFNDIADQITVSRAYGHLFKQM